MPDELASLRRLKKDLPGSRKPLAELLQAVSRADFHAEVAADIIRQDLALSSAIMRTVNTAMYGLLRRVQSVGEALRYLGTDRVLAVTCEIALRQAFPATPMLDRIWTRAAQSGVLMSDAAALLHRDGLLAHSTGLFAHAGMAVMAAHMPDRYSAVFARWSGDPLQLSVQEEAEFGLSHPMLGSAMCASWGLAPAVVRCVRSRGFAPAHWIGLDEQERALCLLGRLVDRRLAGESPPVDDPDRADRAELEALGFDIDEFQAAVDRAWQRVEERAGVTLPD